MTRRLFGSISVVLVVVALAGCAGPIPLASGGYAVPGALIGAAIGAMADDDNRGEGALIGGALGAGVGGVADQQRGANGYYYQQPQQAYPRGYRYMGSDNYGYPVYQPDVQQAPRYRQYRGY